MSTVSSHERSALLDHVDTIGVPDPERYLSQARLAQQLTELSGGVMRMTFNPTSFLHDDRDAQGHLYSGFYSGDGGDFITLDDRQEEPLAVQFAAELRRVARLFDGIAGDVEAKGVSHDLPNRTVT